MLPLQSDPREASQQGSYMSLVSHMRSYTSPLPYEPLVNRCICAANVSMFQSDFLECCCRQSVDWINFEFYEGKAESKMAKDKQDVSRAKQKDLLTFAPAIRLAYSIMGGRRSSHWLKSKATYDMFHNKKSC